MGCACCMAAVGVPADEDAPDDVRDVNTVLLLLCLVASNISRGNKGLHVKQRPFKTFPSSSRGTILKSFFRKHFRPHVTHSPRFLRTSSSSCFDITDPVMLKSEPNESIFRSSICTVPVLSLCVVSCIGR